MRRVTCKHWENLPAGTTVDDGYGGYKTAPSEDGFYTLYELAFDNNRHAGWQWEKQDTVEIYSYGVKEAYAADKYPEDDLVIVAEDTTGMFVDFIAYTRKLPDDVALNHGMTYLGKGLALASVVIDNMNERKE